MRTYHSIPSEERKDKIKSGIITIIIWAVLLLFVFLYKLTPYQDEKKSEVVTTMLINFGDNRNALGDEEPASQEGSLSPNTPTEVEEVVEAAQPNEIITKKSEPQKTIEPKEKIITGNSTNNKVATKKIEKSESKRASNITQTANNKTTSASKTKSNVKNSNKNQGDGKGAAAIGNLIKGRGTKVGSQGTGSGIGNNGDPLGGDGNGDSKIGIDRKLVGYIPGTMGRGGEQPNHSCTATGTINIAYTVDKAGNVVSARRSGGISDPCVVSTSVSWVKKYVKAERSNFSSTGSYKITF